MSHVLLIIALNTQGGIKVIQRPVSNQAVCETARANIHKSMPNKGWLQVHTACVKVIP